MENRHGLSEREVGPPGPDPPPLKPVRPIRRPEMYPSRRMQEQSALLHQHQSVPRTPHWEPSLPRSTSLHTSTSTQSLTPTDPPWGGVTLNRCLLVTVLVLLLTSGLRSLHEALRGPALTHEGEEGLTRHCGALKHRGMPSEPQSSLWEVVFWWVPDMTDDDDEDEESGQSNRGRSKRKVADRVSRGVRNRPLLEKLMKPRENKLKDRRRKKTKDDPDVKKKLKEKDRETEEEDAEESEEDSI